jgi:hypothetical protein
MRRLTIILCLLAIIGLLASCSKKADDETIARDIQNKVSTNPTTQDSQVAVESREGKVTLKGKAKNSSAHDEIVRIAKEEPGVSDVDDETSLDDSASSSSAPTAPSGRLTAAATPPPPPPPPKPVVVPAGTVLTIRTAQAISSKTAQTGHTFTGSVSTPITLDGKMVIPSGADVEGVVNQAKKAGKFKGGAQLALALHSVTVSGHTYNIETELFDQSTTGKGKRTAGVIAGGTGVGAAIGGIAGGGKGAAIGAVTGAAAGTLGAAFTGGNRNIELPAESTLSFRLTQALTLKPEGQEQHGQ